MFRDRMNKSWGNVAHLKISFVVTIFRGMEIETEGDKALVRDKIFLDHRLAGKSGPCYSNEHVELKVRRGRVGIDIVT